MVCYTRNHHSGRSRRAIYILAFTINARIYGLRLSLGSVGDCCDNAMIESFWGRMQTELLNRKIWTTIVELSMEITDCIENFHNTRRRRSSLAKLTPTEYETTNQSHLQLASARPSCEGHFIWHINRGHSNSIKLLVIFSPQKAWVSGKTSRKCPSRPELT